MKKYIVGIDLGGTKIVGGIINKEGELVGEPIKVPTLAEQSQERIEERLVHSIRSVIENTGISFREIKGVGIGSPGPLDLKEGKILNPPNLPTLHNYPIRDRLRQILKLPVIVNNDGNCFVLGESYFGAAKDANIVFGVTLGTGFGSGVVINRNIFVGATGTAAEIHYSPYLGKRFEDTGSAKGIMRIYRKLSGRELSPPQIAERAKDGEDKAIIAWEDYGKHLGIILSYEVNLLDPDIIVIGGSISKDYELFKDSLENNLRENIVSPQRENLKIAVSQLGENTGFIGAACLFFMSKSWR
ncbi:MAG: ROK family protein [bacterium]|nr:ROK family protein [bacterium]